MPQVRDVLMNSQLTPQGWKPVVAIDECQVLDSVFGWGGFRSSYGNETWAWLIAALDPKCADPLLPPKIYFVSCICKGPAMEAQLFYRGTERKVQNTFNYESARLCLFKL